jgi:Flp pilus assembly secretin CpaC
MRTLIPWLLVALFPCLASANEVVKLEYHSSTLVSTTGPIHEMLVLDPRVVAVVPLAGNQFHLQAVGPGETTVTANFTDGGASGFDIQVTKKRFGGKPDFRLSRGRGLLVQLPESVTYVGVGDPNLVNVTHLENRQRYFLVGLNEGKTNLIVVGEQGLQESVVEVGRKIDDAGRTQISLAPTESTQQIIEKRPTNMVVANKQIASASLSRTKDGNYAVTIAGLSAGHTDILVSVGLEQPPIWYTIHVE